MGGWGEGGAGGKPGRALALWAPGEKAARRGREASLGILEKGFPRMGLLPGNKNRKLNTPPPPTKCKQLPREVFTLSAV